RSGVSRETDDFLMQFCGRYQVRVVGCIQGRGPGGGKFLCRRLPVREPLPRLDRSAAALVEEQGPDPSATRRGEEVKCPVADLAPEERQHPGGSRGLQPFGFSHGAGPPLRHGSRSWAYPLSSGLSHTSARAGWLAASQNDSSPSESRSVTRTLVPSRSS